MKRVNDNRFWQVPGSTQWACKCPSCGDDRVFIRRNKAFEAVKEETNCKSCSKMGDKHPMKGKSRSETFKTQKRIAVIEQHRKNGITFPAIDKGAMETFQWLNMYQGMNIQYPNFHLKDLGYFLDGYDATNHTAYEYDHKSHSGKTKKQKDLIRQNRIIQYFENIDNPLNSFIRIDATCVGQLKLNVVHNKEKVLHK